MAKRILVLGGTRFFGKRLVDQLVEQGHDVTVASRNLARGGFDSRVTQVEMDREIRRSLENAVGSKEFDLVYDQICYSPNAALDACEVLRGRTGRVVLTSTQSIYLNHGVQKEADFDPTKAELKRGGRHDFDYGEGKRMAEAAYFQNKSFSLTSVRIPFVLGTDDYTERLDFHIQRVQRSQTIVAPHPDAQMSIISSEEAARFLAWIGMSKHEGAINACSLGEITLSDLLRGISRRVGKEAKLAASGELSDESPYSQLHSRQLDPTKAQELGFEFSEIDDWLPELIDESVEKLTRSDLSS